MLRAELISEIATGLCKADPASINSFAVFQLLKALVNMRQMIGNNSVKLLDDVVLLGLYCCETFLNCWHYCSAPSL